VNAGWRECVIVVFHPVLAIALRDFIAGGKELALAFLTAP
jgi:hypothetical protein